MAYPCHETCLNLDPDFACPVEFTQLFLGIITFFLGVHAVLPFTERGKKFEVFKSKM